MKKVILITCDKCTKEFQLLEQLIYVAKDVQSASHLLTLLENQLHYKGERLNNIKLKNINLFKNNC